MRKLWLCGAVAAVVCFVGVHFAEASRPVPRTITGCVLNGRLYSVQKGTSADRAPVVYPMNVQGINLAPYEGQKVQVQGSLLPGDRFHADPRSIRTFGPCDSESKRAISGRRR